MKTIAQLSIAALMAAGVPGNAVAGQRGQQAVDHTSFASIDLHDIDLHAAAGQKELQRRLKVIVRQHCSGFSDRPLGVSTPPSNGRVVTAPIGPSPRNECTRKANRDARLFREALLERAAYGD